MRPLYLGAAHLAATELDFELDFRVVLKLPNAHSDPPKIPGILRINAIPLGYKGDEGGIFPLA